MKCFFHPKEDALYECTQCNKPICGKCMRFDDEDLVVCPACTLEKAIEVADEETHEFLQDRHRLMQQAAQPKGRWPDRFALLPKPQIAAIVLLIALQLLFRHLAGATGKPTTFDVAEFRRNGDPAPQTAYVVAKVFAYANDHDGKIPESGEALYPQYLEAPAKVLGTDENFTCTPLQGPEQMIVGVDDSGKYGYRKLYAFGDGVLQLK